MQKSEWKNGVLKTDKVRIVITNNHIYYPDDWVVSVRELGWGAKGMGIGNEAEESVAQETAVEMVLGELKAMIAGLENYKIK